MKKKIMAVTLCLAMVSTFAVGCGQKNETDSGKSEEKSSGKVEIEFVQVKREAAESYTKVIEAFEKENPDIVIKQNVVPDAQEVLMTRASSDSLPDMMNHWPTDAQFVQFEDEGLLLDLSEKDYMKNIDSKYLDAVKAKDGKNYIAPYNVNFMGVYYNKDKFEEAGYTMPTKWDELIALVKFILQPIVENIFEHGFTMDENDNKIWIKAFKCENDIVILVKDNGCGIDSEKREEINRILCERTRRISYIDEEEKSIGINNVNTRIKNYYGEKYGVKVNKADKGTEIQLLLGIENLEEENKDK